MIPSPPCPSREELPIRGSQVRRRPQARFLPLPVFVLIVLCGCAGLTPQREWVVLKTSSSTRYEWSIDWRGIETRPALCSPESMTITLKLVVTLPRHDQLNDLSQDIRTNWQRFAARVAAHEQRHVDIYLDGAKTTKTRMEAILKKWSSCSALENVIRRLWAGQQAEIEKRRISFT